MQKLMQRYVPAGCDEITRRRATIETYLYFAYIVCSRGNIVQYTTENTEGYSSEDLETLNGIYEHRIALLDEDERGNPDLLHLISEQVLYDYDQTRDLVPDQVQGSDLVPARVVVRDLWTRGSGDDRAAVALVDLEYPRTGDSLSGIILVAYPWEGGECGTLITQRDWQSPVDAIPLDLNEIQWPNNVIVCGDGLPRYLPGPW